MKSFLITLAMLFTHLGTGNLLGASGRAMQAGQGPGPCEDVVTRLARFKSVSSEWGTTLEGDPYKSTRHSAADGEWFADGFTIYKSKSRFNKSARQISGAVAGVIGRTPLLDEKGRQSGQRVVREMREGGKVTRVHIWMMMGRMIQGIDAPSLELALTVEKALITCPAEEKRRQAHR